MSNMISALNVRSSTGAACPTNGVVGRLVDTQIVKAMLNLPLDALRSAEYRFCADPDCPTVYYSADGLQAFAESDLRERVYQKHPNDTDIFICYCFRHTVGEVRADGRRVSAGIKRGIENSQCACDIRNPQGSCCLGNVNGLLKRSRIET